MKHLIASLLCLAMLAGLVVLFGLIMAGQYERVALGGAFDWAGVREIFAPGEYRKILIAGVIALGFGLLDIQSLMSHGESKQSSEPKPRNQPLGFAAFRARRYFLIIFVLAYVAIAIRLHGLEPNHKDITPYGVYGFSVLFAIARRPINSTIYDVFNFIGEGVSEFLKGIASGR